MRRNEFSSGAPFREAQRDGHSADDQTPPDISLSDFESFQNLLAGGRMLLGIGPSKAVKSRARLKKDIDGANNSIAIKLLS
jgi:hypothetical protein